MNVGPSTNLDCIARGMSPKLAVNHLPVSTVPINSLRLLPREEGAQ